MNGANVPDGVPCAVMLTSVGAAVLAQTVCYGFLSVLKILLKYGTILRDAYDVVETHGHVKATHLDAQFSCAQMGANVKFQRDLTGQLLD